MGDVLTTLLPLILGAMLAPLYPIIVLLLLQSPSGLRKAIALVAGAVTVRLVQGVLFGIVFASAAEAHPDDGPEVIASTLLLVLGLLLLVAAFRKWRKQADPDDPPPAWMTTFSDLSTFKAFGAGAFFIAITVKQWVFTLTAIDVIAAAGLSASSSIAAYLIYTALTQLLVLVPIVAFALAPTQAVRPIKAAHGWLERNNRVIMIVVSLVFGVWLLYKGVTGLVS